MMGVLKPAVVEQALPFLTELGIDQISLFLQAGVAKDRISPKRVERYHSILRASIKQCKRLGSLSFGFLLLSNSVWLIVGRMDR